MNRQDPILVFSYNFMHKKSYDFISILHEVGFKNLHIIAAPKFDLKLKTEVDLSDEEKNSPYNPKNISNKLDLNFYELKHDDEENIAKIVKGINASLAIIAGARIIPEKIINLFSNGIINFHPGKIPETSGLDSFFYTFKHDAEPGVTTHIIDKKVDAGKFIFFERIKLNNSINPHDLKTLIYDAQLTALNRFLRFYLPRFNYDNFPLINRPSKNIPLNKNEKENLLDTFDKWLAKKIIDQEKDENNFLELCKSGKKESIKKILDVSPYMIDIRTPEGWSPIIISSFNQNYEALKLLIDFGANVNDVGVNGTSVFMYAKTKMLTQDNPNIKILKLLLDRGADITKKDVYEKSVFDYIDFDQIKSDKLKSFLNEQR